MKVRTGIFVRPAVVLLCAIVPPLIASRGLWFVGHTHGVGAEPFEVLGMMVSAAILLYWYNAWRAGGAEGRLERLVPALVTGAIVLHVLFIVVNHATTSWDYRCYDGAARALTEGTNPYDGTHYLYPPLLAQCMAAAAGFIESSPLFATDKVTSWVYVFYLYQVMQLLLVFLIAELCFAYTRRLGIPLWWAAALVLVVFVVSAPVFRTLRFHQTNLIVLAAILYSMARLRERPLWCGVVMAVAVMVKPQGIVFPVVWLFIGARKATLGFVAAAAVLVFAQAGFGTDWTTWRQFIDSIPRIPQSNDFFRNQSLFSIFKNVLRTVGIDGDRATLLMVVRGCYAGLLGWFVYRFIEREKMYRSGIDKVAKAARGRYELITRIGAHTVDVVLLALLCSPLVWTHHYAIALPAVLWVVALTRGRVPRLALIALVLMFIPSTFDVWLLSYHRIAGVVMLAIALSPARAFAMASESQKRSYPALAAAEEG